MMHTKTLTLWLGLAACAEEPQLPEIDVPPAIGTRSPTYRARIFDRAGWASVVAVDVNEAGAILAYGRRWGQDGAEEPILVYAEEGQASQVHPVDFVPAGLDDDGVVVGTRGLLGSSAAVRWSNGNAELLEGPAWSNAYGVRGGVVAGACEVLGASHACTWTQADGWQSVARGVALDVSEEGTVVGLGPVDGGAFVSAPSGELSSLIPSDRCGRAVGVSPGGRYVVVAERDRESGFLFDVDPPGGGKRGVALPFLPRAVQDDGLVVGVDTRTGRARAVVADPAAGWVHPLEVLVDEAVLGGARVVDAVAIGSVGQVAATVRLPEGELRPALFAPLRPLTVEHPELPPMPADDLARASGRVCY